MVTIIIINKIIIPNNHNPLVVRSISCPAQHQVGFYLLIYSVGFRQKSENGSCEERPPKTP